MSFFSAKFYKKNKWAKISLIVRAENDFDVLFWDELQIIENKVKNMIPNSIEGTEEEIRKQLQNIVDRILKNVAFL
jgi:hypothetical protein